MVRKFRDDLERKLRDTEFAKEFGAEAAKTDFALTLAGARRRSDITQADLANALGTTQSYIAKLERGGANPTIGTIGKILATLGLRLSTQALPLRTQAYSVSQPRKPSPSQSGEVLYTWFQADIVANAKSRTQESAPLEVGAP